MTGPPRRLGRRTFLTDLGRATLGAVVLGPALAGCSGTSGDGAPGAGARADGDDDAGAPSGLAWERASFGFVSAYVLVRAGEALVFDTGTGDDLTPITAALEAAGVGWGDVGTVLLSHDHGDHVGGIGLTAEQAPGAAFRAAMPDLESVRGRIAGATTVADGDTLLGLRVVATPGHTPGHVSAFDPDSGLLLAGDALVHDVAIGGADGDGVEVSPSEFTADEDRARASVTVLSDLRPATILFGHGEPLREDAADMLATYAAGL